MTKDEALKLALESLESGKNHGIAIDVLRRVLAEQPAQQQEPVAWRYNGILHEFDPSDWATGPVIPLYTSPPESKPWVGLTEKEHTDIAIQCGCMSADWVFYGATVERILKEKNS